MGSCFAFLIALALSAGLSPSVQDRPATVVGVVRDTGGGPLPGVTLTVTLDGREIKTVTDSQGRYSLLLPSGAHTIRASLAGFCSADQRVQATPGVTATVNFDLKLGRLGMIDWVAPPERLHELVASVHTVAHVRVTANEQAAECQQAVPVTARVIDALKPPDLVSGARLTFRQEQWHSEPTPYSVGAELIVLLVEWNATLVRSHGPHAVFLVEDGKVKGSPFLLPPYRRYVGMPIAQFLAELRATER